MRVSGKESSWAKISERHVGCLKEAYNQHETGKTKNCSQLYRYILPQWEKNHLRISTRILTETWHVFRHLKSAISYHFRRATGEGNFHPGWYFAESHLIISGMYSLFYVVTVTSTIYGFKRRIKLFFTTQHRV